MDLDQPSNMVIYVALQKSNIKFAIGTNVLTTGCANLHG